MPLCGSRQFERFDAGAVGIVTGSMPAAIGPTTVTPCRRHWPARWCFGAGSLARHHRPAGSGDEMVRTGRWLRSGRSRAYSCRGMNWPAGRKDFRACLRQCLYRPRILSLLVVLSAEWLKGCRGAGFCATYSLEPAAILHRICLVRTSITGNHIHGPDDCARKSATACVPASPRRRRGTPAICEVVGEVTGAGLYRPRFVWYPLAGDEQRHSEITKAFAVRGGRRD